MQDFFHQQYESREDSCFPTFWVFWFWFKFESLLFLLAWCRKKHLDTPGDMGDICYHLIAFQYSSLLASAFLLNSSWDNRTTGTCLADWLGSVWGRCWNLRRTWFEPESHSTWKAFFPFYSLCKNSWLFINREWDSTHTSKLHFLHMSASLLFNSFLCFFSKKLITSPKKCFFLHYTPQV